MLIRTVFAAVGCAALVAVTAAPAEAASPIQFGRIQYDSPGTDRTTNVSVNGEYVIIKNLGSTARSLTGWTVRDAQHHVYKFATSATRFWGLGWHVWNNTGDKAYLRTAAGTTMDSCVWTARGLGYKNC